MNIALWYGSSYIDFAAYPIMVMITNVIEPNQGPDYAPGSTVQLMCSVDGPFSTVVLMWNSTCTGNCFVLQQSSLESVMKDILHAVDSGNHTCTIVDDVETLDLLPLKYVLQVLSFHHYCNDHAHLRPYSIFRCTNILL